MALVIAGIGYIYVDQREDKVLNYIDAKTNGLVSYMEIGTYKDLPKLLGVSKFLVEKEPPVTPADPDEPEPEPEIPKTCYVYNPEGIDSIEAFEKLFNEQFAQKTEEDTKAEPEKTDEETEEEPTTLFGILEAANVDVENSERIYVIIENEDCNCVIIFDPEGTFEAGTSFPAFSINGDYIAIGGAK